MTTDTPSVYWIQENLIGRGLAAGPGGKGWRENACFTLTTAGVHAVCQPSGKDQTMENQQAHAVGGFGGGNLAVRRLTPLECERLQGFPDNWTRIPYRGKPEERCPDTHRYKAIGNSWAVPCVAWIANRINEELRSTEK